MADLLDPETLTASDGDRFAEAIAFARRVHAGQLRKGTNIPYAVHPLEVGALLARAYPDATDLITAGFLHDTIEDTRVRRGELEDLFGPEVARLVVAVTKRWYRAPWALDTGDPDVVRLKTADLVSNVRSTIVDLREHGPDVWRRFRGGERVKRDYYRKLTRVVGRSIGHEPLARRLIELNELLEAEGTTGR